ncbi:E3 ubiquitin-protein ligase ZNRF4 [Pogoniulus pusillus]|uniref:E3 ubiquitin-protein ligase ZNRF4 n=1 Tax=Pogoniulus pusillus TaxID=488313 RepID=UPI0030B93697
MNPWLPLLQLVLLTAFCSAAPAEALAYVAYNDSSQCVAYKALPACFGPQLPAEELTGFLMEVRPPNACHAIENAPAPRRASELSVALIKAKDCSFVQKVLHAQQAGYQIAVVHNVGSEQLTTMKAEDEEAQQLVKIPSLFTGHSVSLHLQRLLQCKKGEYIKLLPPKPGWSPCKGSAKRLQQMHSLQDFWVIFCSMTATIPLLVGLRWYKRAHKTKLHTCRQGGQYKTCGLCVAEYEDGTTLKILCPSHRLCAFSWLHSQLGEKTGAFDKPLGHAYVQGDLLPEHDEEEEQELKDNAFREGHENEAEEKKDVSSEGTELLDALQSRGI